MATKTLAQFRAERKLWRKDVAQTLGISEEELEALERSPEVPPEIAAKITAAYNLPPDYFAVDLDAMAAAAVQAQKKVPQNPLAYFYKVSWVWQLLTLLILSVVNSVPVIVQTIAGDTPEILVDLFFCDLYGAPFNLRRFAVSLHFAKNYLCRRNSESKMAVASAGVFRHAGDKRNSFVFHADRAGIKGVIRQQYVRFFRQYGKRLCFWRFGTVSCAAFYGRHFVGRFYGRRRSAPQKAKNVVLGHVCFPDALPRIICGMLSGDCA